MKARILAIAVAFALALGLVSLTLALAQNDTPVPTARSEAEREAAAAAALEANPRPALRAAAVFTPPAVISGPLFTGVDDANIFNYVIDPATAGHWPLFDGFEIWGAAFDAAGNRLFFNEGPTLSEWPLDGAPADLGNVVGAESGATLAFYGLAYHDGTLYAARPLHTAADPEGIYTIDPVTLSATLLITYDADLDDIDMGGLAIDPADGALYGTNDAADLRGLVRIDLDGTVTVVAPYPAGQNDIDGLAIGDGRAYLVPDAPGNLFVFDMATLTYTAPITNPWAASHLFSGAGWIEAPAVVTPSIALTKTVGVDATCAATTAITVTAGGDVTYCYQVTNTGNVTLTRHTLTDTHLGGLYTDLLHDLAPLASLTLTETVFLTETTVNTATWTAYNPGPTDVVSATAAATVTVVAPPQAAISLTKTVGVDPLQCAATSAITVTAGTDVTYCYEVTNTGEVTLTLHTLDDSALGALLTEEAIDLAPLASTLITRTASLTETTVNTATWTAYNPGPTDVITATAAATVTVTAIPTAPDIAVSPDSLTLEGVVGNVLTATVTISNSGDDDLIWGARAVEVDCNSPSPSTWAYVDNGVGSIAPGGSSDVVLLIDTPALGPGDYEGILCVTSDDPDEPLVAVPFSVTVLPPPEWWVHLPIIIGSPEGGTRSR